jgi:hypothetical protein
MRYQLVFLVALVGCAAPPAAKPAKPKPVEKPTSVLKSNSGETVAYAPGKRERMWNVRWERAEIRGVETKKSVTDLEVVNGEFYRGDAVQGTYQADSGRAEQGTSKLYLSGNVSVTSKPFKAVLSCRSATYDGVKKELRAVGNVVVTFPDGRIELGEEIVATPDLTRIGTPETFFRPK